MVRADGTEKRVLKDSIKGIFLHFRSEKIPNVKTNTWLCIKFPSLRDSRRRQIPTLDLMPAAGQGGHIVPEPAPGNQNFSGLPKKLQRLCDCRY